MKLYLNLLRYAKPYRRYIIAALACLAVVSALEASKALMVKPVLDEIFINRNKTWWGINPLYILPALVVIVYVAQGVIRYISTYLMSNVGLKVVMDIRNMLYRHLQSLSLKFYKKNPTGILMSRLTNDVSLMQQAVSDLLGDMIREGLAVLALLVVVFYRDWKMALISVAILPAAVIFLAKVGEKLRRLSKRGQERMADINDILQETFTGVRIVKAFNMEERESERFAERNRNYFKVMRRGVKYDLLAPPLMEIIGAVGVAVIIFYGGMKVQNGLMTTGEFFSFITALVLLYSPIRRLSKINNRIQQALGAAERIYELLDVEPDISDAPDALPADAFKHSINFRNVSFKYDSEPVLENINLEVPKGTTLAIVGLSGAGKSTLVDLIPRFYDVTEGAVEVDGTDIRRLTNKSLRALIGIVSQDIFLFNDTVGNNIAYGKPTASEDEIIAAAKAAYAHQFIMEMPENYNTVIQERGSRLSVGQRQRIAIARAILKDPPILILDEATSSLDSESEMMVQEALQNLMRDRTTFVIAHRLSTVLNAHRIIVLDNGGIAQSGTHRELLEKGGLYSRLYRTQFLHGKEEHDPILR